MRRQSLLAILLTSTHLIYAQQRDIPVRKRAFQLSVVPALGTNGLHPGSFENYFSINLSSGYSASTLLFELGVVSNLNTDRTNGFQFAGIANITGGNAFAMLTKKQAEEKAGRGFSADLTGAQFAGLTNVVIGNGYGGQAAVGLNLIKGAHTGIQVSGFGNIVYKYTLGVQLSGFFNTSIASLSGVQVSGLVNHTRGQLAGVQVSLFNQAGNIEGKNSFANKRPTGMQVGLLNVAGEMNGLQFGIINFARRSQGTQIGLINFYKGGKQQETKDGAAIGLLNFGDLDYVSVYSTELFGFNYEVSTGNNRNARIRADKRNVYVTNALIYSHSSFKGAKWAFGYGIKKLFFNRSELAGMTEARFWGLGVDVQHLNNEPGKVTDHLNLLTRVKLLVGRRIVPKLFGVNCFASVSLNSFWSDRLMSVRPEALSGSKELNDVSVEYWPGVAVGVLLH